MSNSTLLSNSKDVHIKPEITNQSPLLDNLILGFAEIIVVNGCTSNNCFGCINDQCSTDNACCCDSR
jgi:hypothetical protein